MNKRQETIAQLVKEKNFISITELSTVLNYSESTIRRDLVELESLKIIKRVSGGAMYIKKEYMEDLTEIKYQINSLEKLIIADIAIDFIEDYSTIFLDSSSTCQYLAKRLKVKKNLTIFTTNLSTADILDKQSNSHNIFFIGGRLSNGKVSGPLTEHNIKNIFVDQAFVSCRGLAKDGYISEVLEEEAMLKKTIRRQAKQLILMLDDVKFNNSFTYRGLTLNDIDIVITNRIPNNDSLSLLNSYKLDYYQND